MANKDCNLVEDLQVAPISQEALITMTSLHLKEQRIYLKNFLEEIHLPTLILEMIRMTFSEGDSEEDLEEDLIVHLIITALERDLENLVKWVVDSIILSYKDNNKVLSKGEWIHLQALA